jgi:carbon-monoxide dehydrogenase medium subunit
MKPSPFVYFAPQTLAEALELLASLDGDGKVLAGGQSLVPILNMRLAAPGHLVDINRIAELSYVRCEDAGVRVGALARHAEVEHDDAAYRVQPLLRQALQLVAHPVIRNRGTTVGSLAHADPSGEMTAVLTLTGGSVDLARRGSRRTVAGKDFFVGPLESVLEHDEIAVSALFPELPPRTGTAFHEVARRHGDYALCGVAAMVTLDDDGALSSARTSYISVGDTPSVLDLTEAVRGHVPADAPWGVAARQAQEQVDPEPDIHASADYRRHLVGVLTERALRGAAERVT